ncbi:peroxidase activity protein [Populus alba x Populus x berolinensis]|nr:peroxidase activity protein [Populus alba x Populus x berolinensis]
MVSRLSLACVVFSLFLISSCLPCQAQLSSNFYDSTCPNALTTIRTAIRRAVSSERRMAASLIRLHFHDCFVQGCDASIMLDNSPSIDSEKFSFSNNNSIRGFEVIDDAKAQVESICPGVVSCADIAAVAARDASVAVGGPSWTVRLGRRDSTTASRSLADSDIPRATTSLVNLIGMFGGKGLSARDMVALSGSHTIGQARCVTFRGRIYDNSSDIDAGFATTRRRNCPSASGNGNNNLAPLDLVTPNSFDNNYFRNLIQRRGLLQSDQALFSGQSTDSIVTEYSRNPSLFISDFSAAMVRMGDIEPLTGSQGEIRRVCSVVN